MSAFARPAAPGRFAAQFPAHRLRSVARMVAESMSDVPLVGQLLIEANRRRFRAASGTHTRLFDGIYPSFAAASAAIPESRYRGYDNLPSATRVIDEWMKIAPYDYPIMFWLARILNESSSVFDWGGNVGLKFFAYRPYFLSTAKLQWLVSDVPAVVAMGETIAHREGVSDRLKFTTATTGLESADVLFAAGALHFIEDPFAVLSAAQRLPPHLLLSKLPLHDRPSAVTLHNMGTAFCPYHLFNRTEFVDRIIALGYRLVDEWQSPDVACSIPFEQDYSIPAYTGLYFTAQK